jgi:glutamate carboxypeptidase
MDFNLANYINDLRYLVNIDSNSLLPQGTQKIAYFFASGYEKLGFTTKYITVNDAVGPCLVITNNEANKYDLLFLSHMDTARPIGSPAITPFRIDKNIAYGPGCGDMKGCALSLLYIFKNIYRSDLIKNHNIMIVMNSDEEISSKYSCKLLKELGSKAKYAIATEAARINGDLVKERLGVARYTLNATE